LVPNASTPLQTTLAAQEHLALSQLLLDENTVDIKHFMMYLAGTR
jgi:hypothetical protein